MMEQFIRRHKVGAWAEKTGGLSLTGPKPKTATARTMRIRRMAIILLQGSPKK